MYLPVPPRCTSAASNIRSEPTHHVTTVTFPGASWLDSCVNPRAEGPYQWVSVTCEGELGVPRRRVSWRSSSRSPAFWPLRGPVGSDLAFVPSWIVGEAPLHLFAVVVAATVSLRLWPGGLSSWPGWAGLALAVMACARPARPVRLRTAVAAAASSRRSPRRARSHRGGAGAAQDTRRVVALLPLRPKGVERVRDIAYADDGLARPSPRPLSQGRTRGGRRRRRCSCTSTAAPG